jgi:hypothetical protein
MKIDANGAVTLAAILRSDLESINRIEEHIKQLPIDNLDRTQLESLGYSLHNLFNALENSFTQISASFENHLWDQGRWHRELLEKMFLDLGDLRPAIFPTSARDTLIDLMGFRHFFRHAYGSSLDTAKTIAVWKRWDTEGGVVKQSLSDFANQLVVP